MDDISVQILGNSPNNTTQKTIEGDFQEYTSVIKIGEYEFDISKRLFIDYLEPLISMDGYIKAGNKIFKILKVKEYSDYMEVWLYALTREVI